MSSTHKITPANPRIASLMEPAKHLADRGGGFPGGILEEHVVAIGDLDEEVPTSAALTLQAPARLVTLGLVAKWLDKHTRGVGEDAECVEHRVGVHRVNDGGSDGCAGVLEPPRHRPAIDRETEPLESILLAVKRQAITPLVARDVRDQRRCRERALEQHRRHRGGDDLRHGDLRHGDLRHGAAVASSIVGNATSAMVPTGMSATGWTAARSSAGPSLSATGPVTDGLSDSTVTSSSFTDGLYLIRANTTRQKPPRRHITFELSSVPIRSTLPSSSRSGTSMRSSGRSSSLKSRRPRRCLVRSFDPLGPPSLAPSLLAPAAGPAPASFDCSSPASIECCEPGRELKLELRGVNALSLGVKQAPLQQLELELELSKRLVQPVMLGLDVGGSLPLGHKRSALGGEYSLELQDPSTRRLGVVDGARLVSHDSHLSGFDRDVDPQSTWVRILCDSRKVDQFRELGFGAAIRIDRERVASAA